MSLESTTQKHLLLAWRLVWRVSWNLDSSQDNIGMPSKFGCSLGFSHELLWMYSVEGLNPAPHIHEQMTTSNYGYDIAYNFTHNNIMLEPNAMNNMNTVAHMDVHNTQY